MAKAPNPVDRHVGGRLRMRRLLVGMSQERLAQALGLTFQQVQKYEKGVNRIGASRLQQIAQALDVPVSFFFEGSNDEVALNGSLAEAPPAPFGEEAPDPAETARLTAAFRQLRSSTLRHRVVALVEAMALADAP